MKKHFTIAVLLLSASVPSFSSETISGVTGGAVCLAPFPTDSEVAPHAGEIRALTATTTFGIRFGKHQNVLLKQGRSLSVSSLPLNEKIRVNVSMDGKPYESFVLNFAELKTDKVCMWLYLPYVTWQVVPYSGKRYGCKCFG